MIMNYSLNEAFESTFIKKYWRSKDFEKTIRKICDEYKLDINRIDDKSFARTDPKIAAKINSKDVFKFWIWKGKLEVATHSNSLFDISLETSPRKLNRVAIAITNMPFTHGQGDTTAMWKAFLSSADECWMLNITTAATLSTIRNERSAQKQGATAMMNNREIKAMNLKRFAQNAKKLRFSEGSETDLILNINKYLQNVANKTSATGLFCNILAETWVGNYILAYSSTLMDYFDELNKNGFLVPIVEDKNIFSNEGTYELSKLRPALIKSLDDAKRELESISNGKWIKSFVNGSKSIMNKDERFMKLLDVLSDKDIDLMHYVSDAYRVMEEYGTQILKNTSISENIMNFDMLWIQMNGLKSLMKDGYSSLKSIAMDYDLYYDSWIKESNPSKTNLRYNYINNALVKRTESVFRTMANI